MHALKQSNMPPAPHRPRPLAQVEVLMLFHPELQSGGPKRVAADICARAAQGWLTLDVFGRRGKSELTGRPIMEDMRLEVDGEDVESLLPGGIVDEVADYMLDDL